MPPPPQHPHWPSDHHVSCPPTTPPPPPAAVVFALGTLPLHSSATIDKQQENAFPKMDSRVSVHRSASSLLLSHRNRIVSRAARPCKQLAGSARSRIRAVLGLCDGWWEEAEGSVLLLCWSRAGSCLQAPCSLAQRRSFTRTEQLIHFHSAFSPPWWD